MLLSLLLLASRLFGSDGAVCPHKEHLPGHPHLDEYKQAAAASEAFVTSLTHLTIILRDRRLEVHLLINHLLRQL